MSSAIKSEKAFMVKENHVPESQVDCTLPYPSLSVA